VADRFEDAPASVLVAKAVLNGRGRHAGQRLIEGRAHTAKVVVMDEVENVAADEFCRAVAGGGIVRSVLEKNGAVGANDGDEVPGLFDERAIKALALLETTLEG